MEIRRRRVYAPPGEGMPFLGQWDGVPDHVPVLCPRFLPLLAAVSPKRLATARWIGGKAEIRRRGVSLTFSDRETIPQAGPLAVKTLLLAYAVFSARPHGLVQGKLPEEALTISVPIWDAALLFGLEGVEWATGSGRPDPAAYEKIAVKLQHLGERLRAALRFLSSVSARIDGRAVPLLDRESGVAGGGIVFRLSPEIGLALAESGATHVPACLFRLPMKERTAFALGLKICSFASIRRNYGRGRVPRRLRVRTLLAATPLPFGEIADLRKKASWRLWTQVPFERAMDRLLYAWGYEWAGDFLSPEAWMDSFVVFSLSRFPRISPPEGGRHGIA